MNAPTTEIQAQLELATKRLEDQLLPTDKSPVDVAANVADTLREIAALLDALANGPENAAPGYWLEGPVKIIVQHRTCESDGCSDAAAICLVGHETHAFRCVRHASAAVGEKSITQALALDAAVDRGTH